MLLSISFEDAAFFFSGEALPRGAHCLCLILSYAEGRGEKRVGIT
jgi:hypothetical protein